MRPILAPKLACTSLRPPRSQGLTVRPRGPGTCRSTRCNAAKMFVPGDSFGGCSPERKAASALRGFFTYTAARVVLFQLEGPAGPRDVPMNREAYNTLSHYLHEVPIKDGDEWLASILKQDRSLGLRLMEVRDAYCADDFDWTQLATISVRETREANAKLMRQAAMASFQATAFTAPLGSGASEDDVPN